MAVEKIGRYEIKGFLGQGTMGVVYKGYDPQLERFTAIKVMNTSGEMDDELRARFFQEARAVAKLNHSNIISIYDLGEDKKRPFIAMEYVEGEDLKTVIKKRTFIPFEQKLRFVSQMCEGLDYAHSKGVVHRDIKPGNVFILRSGALKILDFGLARLASSEMTRSGMLMGSPYYMSPEQVKGIRDIDGRSDLFSVGVVLYELLAYSRPFEGDTPTSVCFQIVSEPHQPVSRVLPGCAPELAEIVDKALAKDRDARYQSGTEFIAALLQFKEQLPGVQKLLVQAVNSLQGSTPDAAETTHVTVPQHGVNDYGTLLLRQAELEKVVGADHPEVLKLKQENEEAHRTTLSKRTKPAIATADASEDTELLETTQVMESAQVLEEVAPTVEPPTIPGPSRTWLIAGSVSLILLLGIEVMWWSTGDQSDTLIDPAAVTPGQVGSLILSVAPWANVQSITNTDTNEAISVEGLVTPCVVPVPPGEYRVRVSNPSFETPLEFEVSVLPGQASRVHKKLPDFDLEAELSVAIGEQSGL